MVEVNGSPDIVRSNVYFVSRKSHNVLALSRFARAVVGRRIQAYCQVLTRAIGMGGGKFGDNAVLYGGAPWAGFSPVGILCISDLKGWIVAFVLTRPIPFDSSLPLRALRFLQGVFDRIPSLRTRA
jgi:hypothetical protein